MLARQQGVSLVELMVALLLASVITLIALVLLWQQQRAWREHLAMQQIQEEGHLLVRLLRDEAAYAGAHLEALIPPFLPQAETHRNADLEHSVVSFYSQDLTDCLGRNLAAPEIIVNQYYVRANGDGVNALYCRSLARGTWEETELVSGVELFQARVLVELPEGRFAYLAPEAFLAEASAHALEVLVVLRHPQVTTQAQGELRYTDLWGVEKSLDKNAVHGRFFVRQELFNG